MLSPALTRGVWGRKIISGQVRYEENHRPKGSMTMGNLRYFTVEQANSLLPSLELRFTQVMQLRGQLRTIYQQLEGAGEPPTPDSLMRRDGEPHLLTLRGNFRALAEALAEEVSAIEELGVAIKDLDIGLCDFLGEREGRDVWLCWRLGEKLVTHWHELDDGFAGRQPLEDGRTSERLLH
jgi:hypothetical protein